MKSHISETISWTTARYGQRNHFISARRGHAIQTKIAAVELNSRAFDARDEQPLIGEPEVITLRKIMKWVGAEPFLPFRIKLAGGTNYEICDPEDIFVGKYSASIFVKSDDTLSGGAWHEVSLSQLESVGPLKNHVARDQS